MPTASPTKPTKGTRTRGRKPPTGWRKWLRIALPLLLIVLVLAGLWMLRENRHIAEIENPKVAALAKLKLPSYVTHDILPQNANSRRGVYLEDVGGIVIHFVGNPNTTAKQNRSFFGLAETTVNAHFLVGLEGEVIQCLPLEEKSSASNERNRDTISIEVCHPDDTGQFSDVTYQRVVELTAWLCQNADLKPEQVIRHYDVTGKLCPLYYVDHPEAWTQFLQDVTAAMEA